MFPLGSVLLPGAVLPLHVFEERYRAMTRHCLDGDGEFGVVLIELGSEVGGADVRTSVGTVATIGQAAELPDGRWVLATVGTRRLRVVEWLPDDPWPRAMVEDFPDDPPAGAGSAARWEDVRIRLRRVLAMAVELGEAAAPVTVELSPEPSLGSFQAAAVAPLGPLDQLRVLGTAGVDHRLDLLVELLGEQAELLGARLAG
jgi:Lon protease-like protein